MWMDVEVGAPDDVLFMFGGETLGRVTNNFILPAVHQVVTKCNIWLKIDSLLKSG